MESAPVHRTTALPRNTQQGILFVERRFSRQNSLLLTYIHYLLALRLSQTTHFSSPVGFDPGRLVRHSAGTLGSWKHIYLFEFPSSHESLSLAALAAF